MGQKAIVQTLRKPKTFNILSLNKKTFFKALTFIDCLKKVFNDKKIFLTNFNLNNNSNKIILNFNLFYQTTKLLKYKRKFKDKNIFLKNNFKHFSSLYNNTLKELQRNFFTFNFKVLNNEDILIRKNLFLFLYKKFKKFHTAIFPRRFNFFIDFLNLTVLFLASKISLSFYIQLFNQIFKILPKRRHNFFIAFVERFFKVIIYDLREFKENNIKGIKFMISGRLQAKPRAKFKYFQIGKVPMQSIHANISFAKTHVYTVFGVFGIKIWINYL